MCMFIFLKFVGWTLKLLDDFSILGAVVVIGSDLTKFLLMEQIIENFSLPACFGMPIYYLHGL